MIASPTSVTTPKTPVVAGFEPTEAATTTTSATSSAPSIAGEARPATMTTPSSVTSSEEEQLRFRPLQELYDVTSPVELDQLELCMFGAEEPRTLVETEKHFCWRKAMEEELASIRENETWELTNLPARK